jgi:hypothetical protein
VTQVAALVKSFDDFIKGCKTDGTWGAIKASCIMAGWSNLNGALTPLVGAAPTNVGGLFVAGDYNRTTGLKGGGTGSGKYLDSKRSNTTDPQNNRHMAVYVSEPQSPGIRRAYISNLNDAIGSSYFWREVGGQVVIRLAGNSVPPVAGTDNPSGFIGGTKVPATTRLDMRVAGVTTSDALHGNSTPSSGNLLIFRGPFSQTTWYSDARLSFYSLGESLNLALLDARVSTLMTDIASAIP